MILELTTLILFSLGLVYSVLFNGGVWPSDWHVTLMLIGLGSLIYWLSRAAQRTPKMEAWLRWSVLMLPLYVSFQLIPLPENVLAIISPERAEQVEALRRIAKAGLVPITVSPPATIEYLFRILC